MFVLVFLCIWSLLECGISGDGDFNKVYTYIQASTFVFPEDGGATALVPSGQGSYLRGGGGGGGGGNSSSKRARRESGEGRRTSVGGFAQAPLKGMQLPTSLIKGFRLARPTTGNGTYKLKDQD